MIKLAWLCGVLFLAGCEMSPPVDSQEREQDGLSEWMVEHVVKPGRDVRLYVTENVDTPITTTIDGLPKGASCYSTMMRQGEWSYTVWSLCAEGDRTER